MTEKQMKESEFNLRLEALTEDVQTLTVEIQSHLKQAEVHDLNDFLEELVKFKRCIKVAFERRKNQNAMPKVR